MSFALSIADSFVFTNFAGPPQLLVQSKKGMRIELTRLKLFLT